MWSKNLAKHQGLVLLQANSGSLIKWSDQTPQSVRNQPRVVRSLELAPPKDSPNSVLCIATRGLTALEVRRLAAIFGSIDDFQERRSDDSFRVALRLYEIKYTHRNSAILVHGLEFDTIGFTSSVPMDLRKLVPKVCVELKSCKRLQKAANLVNFFFHILPFLMHLGGSRHQKHNLPHPRTYKTPSKWPPTRNAGTYRTLPNGLRNHPLFSAP